MNHLSKTLCPWSDAAADGLHEVRLKCECVGFSFRVKKERGFCSLRFSPNCQCHYSVVALCTVRIPQTVFVLHTLFS